MTRTPRPAPGRTRLEVADIDALADHVEQNAQNWLDDKGERKIDKKSSAGYGDSSNNDYQLTYVTEKFDIKGDFVGAGILIVDGELKCDGDFHRTAKRDAAPDRDVDSNQHVYPRPKRDALAADCDADVRSNPQIEVPVLLAGREGVDVEKTTGQLAHTHPHVNLVEAQAFAGVEPEDPLVDAGLRLTAQTVVDSCEHDDQLVTGVDRLADEARVVRGLARLHLAGHQAAAEQRGRRVTGACGDGGTPPYRLTHGPRDGRRGPKLPLEHVVHRQTRQTAELYGLRDRGLVAPGMRADLDVIDFDRLRFEVPRMAFDLPAGGRRLVQRARGYAATFVAGVQTVEDDEPTGELPGRRVRGPQPDPTT